MDKVEREVYTPKDISILLGIGINRAYELVHTQSFPVIVIGHSYRVPKKAFEQWMDRYTAHVYKI